MAVRDRKKTRLISVYGDEVNLVDLFNVKVVKFYKSFKMKKMYEMNKRKFIMILFLLLIITTSVLKLLVTMIQGIHVTVSTTAGQGTTGLAGTLTALPA